jgi:UMF1 family MFS transporter
VQRVYVWILWLFNFISFSLMMVMKPAWFGISDSSLPARISFLAVGIWWIGFAQVTLSFA